MEKIVLLEFVERRDINALNALLQDHYEIHEIEDVLKLSRLNNIDLIIFDMCNITKEKLKTFSVVSSYSKEKNIPIILNVNENDKNIEFNTVFNNVSNVISYPYNKKDFLDKIYFVLNVLSEKFSIEHIKKNVESFPAGFAVFSYIKSTDMIELLYVNEHYYDLINATKENRTKYNGMSFSSALYTDDAHYVYENLKKATRSIGIIDFDFRIIDGKYDYIWLNFRVKKAYENNKNTILFASIINVDDRKKQRLILEKSQKVLEIASKLGSVNIWLYNINKRQVISGLIEDGINGVSEVVDNVPESVIASGYVYKDDINEFRSMYERIIDGADRSECIIRLLNNKTKKFTKRHIVLSHIDDEQYFDNYACGIITEIEGQYVTPLQNSQAGRVRQELLKRVLVYYEINLTKGIIEKNKAKHFGETIFKPYTIINNNVKKQFVSKVYSKEKELFKKEFNFSNMLDRFEKGESNYEIKYRRKMLDGLYYWVKTTINMFSRLEDDDIIAYIYVDDINDEYNDKLAFDNIIDEEIKDIGILNIKTGRSHLLRDTNNIFKYGLGEDFVYDTYISELIKIYLPKDDVKRCEDFFNISNLLKNINENRVARISFNTIIKNNVVLRKTVIAKYLDSRKNDIVISIRDTTKLYEEEQKKKDILEKAVAEAVNANKARNEFISRISHDMRTPLNAIIGLLTLAKEEPDSTKQYNYLDSISDSSYYLLGLINDMLDLNRIESGNIELHEELFSLPDFTRNIDTVIRPLMEKKHINFIFNMGCGAYNIYVDKIRFCQIFFNILTNAAKFTPAGGTVEFSAEHIDSDENGRYGMRYHIIDNGKGMKEEFLEHVFEPFSKENNTGTSQQTSGLGLSIVKRLVDLMGGKISCKSKLGEGTEFIVDLYAFIKVESEFDVVKKTYDFTKLCDLHILIVEDNELNTIIIKNLLEKVNCIVDCAENGLVGLNKYKESGLYYYDVIIMDIRMPIMNGLEATEKIRALNRDDAKHTKIIVLSADTILKSTIDIEKGLIDDYLTKPIEPKTLYQTIINSLEKK